MADDNAPVQEPQVAEKLQPQAPANGAQEPLTESEQPPPVDPPASETAATEPATEIPASVEAVESSPAAVEAQPEATQENEATATGATTAHDASKLEADPSPKDSEPRKKEENIAKLVILGLPWETTEATLLEYFSQFGSVVGYCLNA